ncbi:MULTISPECIES: DUF2599 domain-containing protein [Pseudomonas]|uniref:Metalloprotease StcE beta-sandwich domain-containing protein n=1 Tax=Pseudomonas asplenii TaxID=53407 RepID=A0A0N0E536_9PSED|nr:DUF2599 domain-containing protein [Pseudomonas fuscovaginae]KPA92007.1 Protein of unknown function (DUF2599) [Pseudomonas fuscovaginae]KPA94149.1 Protein of unknown function (DUF2599) [Pseudomonas fuscovaginae]
MKPTTCLLLMLSLMPCAHAIDLTPGQTNGRGRIPGAYGNTPGGDPAYNFPMTFRTGDGDWASDLSLPDLAPAAAQLTVSTGASYPSVLSLRNTDIGVQSISMNRGDSLAFLYDSASQRWKVQTHEYTPNTVGAVIPDFTSPRVIRYSLGDGDWTDNVTLPGNAGDGNIVLVRSDATYSTTISPPPGTGDPVVMNRGESYAFVYQYASNRWNGTRIRYLSNPIAQRLNDNYNEVKNDCLEYGSRARRGHYYCSGNIIRATTDGNYNPWERPSTGSTSYSWIRKDIGTDHLYRPVGFILRSPLYAAIRGLPGISVGWTCLYPFDGWTNSGKDCDGITAQVAAAAGWPFNPSPAPRPPTGNSGYAFGSCDKLGITTREQWLQFFAVGQNALWNQCSWNVDSQTSWNAMLAIHQSDITPYSQIDPQSGIDASWYKPGHNELRLNNAASNTTLNAQAIEAIYFDVNAQPGSLDSARNFQRKLGQAGYPSVPIVQLNFRAAPSERFNFAASDQAETYNRAQCTQYIDSATWIQRYDPGTGKNEWTLSVLPTECGRNIQSDQSDKAYAELLQTYGNDPAWKNNDGGGMRRQLICHLAIARQKAPWNLEPFRPDVSQQAAIDAGCNPVSR